MNMNRDFQLNPDRIYLNDDSNKMIAEVTFPETSENTVTINHTFVDDSLRGQGIAGQLMEEVVKQLRLQNKKAIPTCSYAVQWFSKHPECHDVLI
jgi:predicted GNAT family acetyltransferase